MVKRYDLKPCGLCDMCEIDEVENGDYVDYEDYLLLRTENEALQFRLEVEATEARKKIAELEKHNT